MIWSNSYIRINVCVTIFFSFSITSICFWVCGFILESVNSIVTDRKKSNPSKTMKRITIITYFFQTVAFDSLNIIMDFPVFLDHWSNLATLKPSLFEKMICKNSNNNIHRKRYLYHLFLRVYGKSVYENSEAALIFKGSLHCVCACWASDHTMNRNSDDCCLLTSSLYKYTTHTTDTYTCI